MISKGPFQIKWLYDNSVIQPRTKPVKSVNQKPVSAGLLSQAGLVNDPMSTRVSARMAIETNRNLASLWKHRGVPRAPAPRLPNLRALPVHWTCYINRKLFRRLKRYSLFSSKETGGCQCTHKQFATVFSKETWERKQAGRPDSWLTHIPIVYRGSWIITCFHFYHEQREEKEEHCHGKADSIDSSVSNKHIAADKAIHMRYASMKPLITKSRYLSKDTFSCEFTSAFAISFFKHSNS